ncbi:1304_t:CDS:1 [Diversispora eburnea]|uniref:1304_t:CDS:1 n=1 Tax=Diversispora eburnea TaxID=1213867 RepID=A0A9N8V411_9GLOM|nr:1304_t:CDS:1 [Diversispora eburnea]
MEFYRSGNLFWPLGSIEITREEIDKEFKYIHQIEKKNKNYITLAIKSAANTFDQFILTLDELIILFYKNFKNEIILFFYEDGEIRASGFSKFPIEFNEGFAPFKGGIAYNLLMAMGQHIKSHLEQNFEKINLKWECNRCNFESYLRVDINFTIDLTKIIENSSRINI